MAGALYTGLRLEEDWLRAALYLIIFVTLSLAGPGRFSIDRWLQIRKKISALRQRRRLNPSSQKTVLF
jgi:hypothetical protein